MAMKQDGRTEAKHPAYNVVRGCEIPLCFGYLAVQNRILCRLLRHQMWHLKAMICVDVLQFEALNLAEKAIKRLTNSLEPGLEDKLWNRTVTCQHRRVRGQTMSFRGFGPKHGAKI